MGQLVVAGGISAAAAAAAVTAVAGRTFGGVTGDVMGAAHETGRAAAVLVMVSI